MASEFVWLFPRFIPLLQINIQNFVVLLCYLMIYIVFLNYYCDLIILKLINYSIYSKSLKLFFMNYCSKFFKSF